MNGTGDAPLTLERLFDSPSLSGPAPGMARYAPGGRRIAWLRPADDDFERLDLWLHDLDTGTSRCLVDARRLRSDRALSEEEKARRERLRVFAGGIVEFQWNHDGSAVLFPVAGRLHRLRLDAAEAEPEAVTPPDFFVTDVRCAPGRDTVAFVHERNLWVQDGDGPPRALTHDGGGDVSWGLADFIAAEEMHRFDGYFFSPDGARIAVLRVDETPIPLSHRYEITADGFSVHPQRYPYTGGPNADVRLAVVPTDGGEPRELDWRTQDAEYLARVAWRPDGAALFVQRQSRDQRRLELVEIGLEGGSRVVLSERSDTWINLHDDLRLLEDGRTALWTSERDGPRRLYRLALADGGLAPLTPADGHVFGVSAVDEAAGRVFVEAWYDQPTQRHLYEVPLDGSEEPRRLTPGTGVHDSRMAPDFGSFLDRRQDLEQPPSLELREAGGSLLLELGANHPGSPSHPYHPFLSGHRPARLGTLEAEDGQTLHYRLTPPAGVEAGDEAADRYPVIVSVYGGPGVHRVQEAWPPLVHQYFARRGWGVFELDNRGAAGRGREFEAPIHRRLGTVETNDQLRGVEFLRGLDWVDPDRIAVFGHSYGGYMALMCLARHPEAFAAAVSVAPVTDWLLYDTHYTERYMDLPERNPEGYRDASVLSWVDGLAAAPGALLLMHGMADDNVLFTHTTRLMKALQDRSVAFETMAYPAAKHGIAGRAIGLHRFRLIERFLERRFAEAGARGS